MKSNRTELPAVEKGIPCPFSQFHKPKRSRWFQFLKDLVPGDSFLVSESELINVTPIASQIQVNLAVKHGPHQDLKVPDSQARCWRMGEQTSLPDATPKTNVKLPHKKPGPKPKVQGEAISLL